MVPSRYKPTVIPEKAPAEAEKPADVAEEKAPALAGRTIVVADDEPDQVTMLSTIFEDHGATVREAAPPKR